LCSPFQCPVEIEKKCSPVQESGKFEGTKLNIKEENMYLKQKMQLNDEAKRRLELLAEVAEI
jgi:hypothetical protein